MNDTTPMTGPWLLYGANGYTGELVARTAVARGHRPVLAGRHAGEVSALAEELGLERRLFGLQDPARIEEGLDGMALVLHCAGPFTDTWRPMADACLRTRTHYLDLTGEVVVLESLAARDEEARAAGVMLLPGCGFEVVPADCLALHLKGRLPSARKLRLAYAAFGRLSRGTRATALLALRDGGLVRRDGVLVSAPLAGTRRRVDFGFGPVSVASFPLADLATSWRTTGIPDIELYLAAPPDLLMLAWARRRLGGLLRNPAVQAFLGARARSGRPGPSGEERRRGRAHVWGEVEDESGRKASSRLLTPEAYTLTARAAVATVERVLGGRAPAGYTTPAAAFGADFVLGISGVTRTELPDVP